ncbi:hypothetical protein HI914_07069 [Erysiphe necator]|nr:hypothetical protein HI914_07069 [Erysiphe necator]
MENIKTVEDSFPTIVNYETINHATLGDFAAGSKNGNILYTPALILSNALHIFKNKLDVEILSMTKASRMFNYIT